MTKTRQRNSALKTYEVTYSEDVSRYGEIDIEAASPQEAIEKARAQDLAGVCFGIETSDPFRREIMHIQDEDGVTIAEGIPLDDFFTVSGEQERRLFECAREMLEALRWQEMADADPQASRRKGYFDRAREARRAVIAKVEGSARYDD